MYELIELFSVPTPLSASINAVLNCIDKALADRDSNVDKFCTHLDKDIAELGKEVKEVKQESQNPAVLDPKSDPDQVKLYSLIVVYV